MNYVAELLGNLRVQDDWEAAHHALIMGYPFSELSENLYAELILMEFHYFLGNLREGSFNFSVG